MKFTLFFDKSLPEDYILLGGKGASLASMSIANLPVPLGFCVTTDAYSNFIHNAQISQTIIEQVNSIDCTDIDNLERKAISIRALILDKPLPLEVEQSIRTSYELLCQQCGTNNNLPVAVRSSATAEDLPNASFAGQQDTYLWVVGISEVLEHVRKCWASLYTSRAINYRKNQQIAEDEVLMCVVIQKMVNASTAGVTMTLNPINGDRSKIVIDSSWGLGEAVVSGEVTPDNFLVDKIMLEIIKKDIKHKHIAHLPDSVNRCVKIVELEDEKAKRASLTDDEVKDICRVAKIIEKHYKCPQDIEWALDSDLPAGQNVTLLQSRPETVWSQKKINTNPTLKTGMEGILNTLMNPLAGKK
jgi:pyruvate, water dikinase